MWTTRPRIGVQSNQNKEKTIDSRVYHNSLNKLPLLSSRHVEKAHWEKRGEMSSDSGPKRRPNLQNTRILKIKASSHANRIILHSDFGDLSFSPVAERGEKTVNLTSERCDGNQIYIQNRRNTKKTLEQSNVVQLSFLFEIKNPKQTRGLSKIEVFDWEERNGKDHRRW